MGETIEFPIGRALKRTNRIVKSSAQLLREAIISTEVQDKTQVAMDTIFSRTSNPRERVCITSPQLAFDKANQRGGVLYPVSTTNSYVTSGEFFDYLCGEGLDKASALNLSSSTVLAYTSLHTWIKHDTGYGGARLRQELLARERVKPYLALKYPNLWPNLDYENGSQSSTMLFHRIAARVALSATGITDFDPSMQAPLPLHVAALGDPVQRKSAGLLHDVIATL